MTQARNPTIQPITATAPHVRIHDVQTLSDHWYVLRKVSFDLQRRNGVWQQQIREVYDRGNGAVILLYSASRGTIVLTKQFRLPTFVNGNASGYLLEACAGLLDGDDPETCIRKEAQEETGYVVQHVQKVFEAYMSPGSVTEKLHFFIADYAPTDRIYAGGGVVTEGEDIEVLEMSLQNALAAIESGEIQDAKTIMLLQYVALQSVAHRNSST